MFRSTARFTLRRAVMLACLSFAAAGAHAADAVKPKAWDSGVIGESAGAGDSLAKSGYTANANSWTDNQAKLANGAWPHSGGSPWFVFNLTQMSDVTITVSNAQANAWAPGMTVWANGANMFDGGSANETELGQITGTNAPHSFNQVGQIGSAGTGWMSGSLGNMLETLAYANSGVEHADPAANDWNTPILYGVHDVSVSSLYESGVSGSVGNGFAQLVFADLQPGWYTIFVGGACTACGNSTFNLGVDVAPVPEPETWAMLLAGLGLVGFAARRRGLRV